MTVPANLFVDAPEVQDAALTRLSNESETWTEEILQKLHERVPQSQPMNVLVKFMKKDEENGAATGGIIVNSTSDAAVIPIIIKDFMLSPLDVMFARGKLLPLTPDYFDSVFQAKGVFDRLEEFPSYGGLGRMDEGGSLWNSIYPPNMGRYAHASEGFTEKQADEDPLLTTLAGTYNGAEFKDWIEKNPEYYVGFKKHGHVELLRKLVTAEQTKKANVNMNEFRPGVDRLIPRSVLVARREGANKYSLLSSNDEVFSPAITTMDRESLMACIGRISELSNKVSDTVNEIDQTGEKILLMPTPQDSVLLAQPELEVPEDASTFGHYAVKTNTGVTEVGVVIPKVIDFDQKTVNLKVFIGKTMQTMQPDIYGVRLKNNPFTMQGCLPKVGQTGTFVYQPDGKHALCTVPVTIRSVSTEFGSLVMTAIDLLGRGYRLSMMLSKSPSGQLQRIAESGGTYLLPNKMKWVVMEGFNPISNSAASYAVKTAGEKLSDRPVTLISTGFGQYAMRGVSKYASAAGWDKTNLRSSEATFLLATLGLSQEKIAEAFKTANMRGRADIHHARFLPLKSEKIAEAIPRAKALTKIAEKLRRNLFKEASYIDNAQTVDVLLSLNFVNPSNIAKFIGKIPQLKSAVSCLGSLLLASRIGLKEVPEQAASTAMHQLLEVVDGLEKLKASQEIAGI